MILVAISLDPHHVQEADFELPLWEFGQPDNGALDAADLMRGHRFTWYRQDPAHPPRSRRSAVRASGRSHSPEHRNERAARVVTTLASDRSRSRRPVTEDPLWYKDAIIYQLHVKSFFDANNDGVGDFPGLLSKLDYIAELGVSAIWLLPFYPSPLLR